MADDVGDLRKAPHGGGLDVRRRAPRHIVEDHGQVSGFRNGLEVLVKALLRRFVVIGRNGKDALHAQSFDFGRQVANFLGVVAAHSRDDGNFSTRFFHDHANHPQVFAVFERGGFAGGAAGDKEIDPLAKLELHQPPQRRFIHGTVFPKGGDEGRAATANFQAHGDLQDRGWG